MLRVLRTGNKRTKLIWWVLIIITVVTFVLGFNVLMTGFDTQRGAQAVGAKGIINGERVSQQDYEFSLSDARANYRRQYGMDPADRDQQVVELQAWRNVVNNQLLADQAKKAGLKASDPEVVLTLQANPPQALTSNPVFLTDGKFDIQKYRAAATDTRPEMAQFWAAWENQVRRELPVRKIQERLLASIKLSDPELREAFHDRFDRLTATLVQVPPADSGSATATDADLQKVFDKYKTRFSTGARTQLEVLAAPKKYTDEDTRQARELANSLRDRARRGEDFAQLAKDYSEGPNAEKGGLIDRFFSPSELGPVLGQHLSALRPGEVADPFQEGSRFMVFKILDPARDTSAAKAPYPGALKLAQIVVKIHPAGDGLRQQATEMVELAKRARSVGLSRAATEKALTTTKTSFFDYRNEPPQLFATPEAADWGLTHAKDQVSPLFEGPDEFVIVQVVAQHPAGPPSREEVNDQLRAVFEVEHRVDRSKSRADQIAAALRSGQTVEQAAAAAGLTPIRLDGMTRAQPDPRIVGTPALIGQLWSAKPGQVIGPLRATNAWYFARLDGITAAPDTMFNQMKGQITTDILTRRQRSFFDGYIEKLRTGAKIEDLRLEGQN